MSGDHNKYQNLDELYKKYLDADHVSDATKMMQHEWVGLKDSEIAAMVNVTPYYAHDDDLVALCKCVEELLRSKNHVD
jgi:hypothetical protein